MWKKIEKLSDKKEKVDELALKLLGPYMPKLRDELLEFVPRPPINRKDETLWLLQSNSFNLEQVHKNFLLFEDKMDEHFSLHEDQIDKHSLLPEDRIDNSADLQCTKAVYLGQKNCLKSQKYGFLKQMDLLHRSNPNRSNLTSNQEKNKDLNSLQNNNMPLGIKRKSSEQIYLPKKKKRGLKSKKVKNKKEEESRKVIIIDLTGDDEISVPCKRKGIKHNLKFLKIMKDIIKNKKYINTLKHSSKFITSMNEKSSNRDRKSTAEKVLEHKFNLNSKISDNKSYTSISNKYSLNINFQKSEHLKFDQDKESKIMTNVLKGSKPENDVSSHMTCMTENAIGLYNNTMTQKETLTSEEQMDTIPYGPLLKMCQSDIVDFFKQEIPITNCDAMQSYSWKMSQIVCHQLNKCEDCKKIYSKSFIFPDSTTQEHSTFTKNDVKACGNIVYIKSNTRCVIMPHNDDIVTCCDMHKKEERMQCQHDSNDMYTTFTEDQIKSSLDNQNINLDDKRKHGSKHSETAIKPQQAKSDCDILLSNDQLPPTEHFFSYIDSEYSNMDSKEANEIMETYCNGDLLLSENISSFDNQIGILEILENMSNKTTNFFQQSPFESDHIHTNTFLSEKDILCNNQNNAINATVNSITFE
ncbi:hypothetical protein EAG_09871 [Camponotus floridanus]|uniref:Uncharacterized protein n=2 Tax=Camponotus floridanus TaxID=104421 RepID=E2A697_CAMFO|nr:hypothetical protein EAG_09871 [Camponotus floridanus]